MEGVVPDLFKNKLLSILLVSFLMFHPKSGGIMQYVWIAQKTF